MQFIPHFCLKLCLKDQRKSYSINTHCLSVTTGLDKLLINYNLVNLRYIILHAITQIVV